MGPELSGSEIAGDFIKDFMEPEDRELNRVNSVLDPSVYNCNIRPVKEAIEYAAPLATKKISALSKNEEVKKVCVPNDLVEEGAKRVCVPSDLVDLWQKLWQGICVTINKDKKEQVCEVIAPSKTVSSTDSVNPTDTTNTVNPTDTANSHSIKTGANVIVVVKNDKIGFLIN